MSETPLNNLAVIAAAVVVLTLAYALMKEHLIVHVVSPATAADMWLARLVRLRVAERFQKAGRLSASPEKNRETVDVELGKIRHHPLYAVIRKEMAAHLRAKGFYRVSTIQTADPGAPMLSMQPDATLNRFVHSLRASFHAPDKLAAELNHYGETVEPSMVKRQGPKQHEIAFSFLLQLLSDRPDDMEPVAGAVRFLPISTEDMERTLLGDGDTTNTSKPR